MAKHCDRPVVFPCSNPTANAECTAEQVYDWTKGRGVFAAGSPFEPFQRGGKTIYPSQGNNMYIFPGLGQACVISKARVVNQKMLYRAALAVGECLTPDEIAQGRTFPDLSRIVEVSRHVAIEVARSAILDKVAPEPSHEFRSGLECGTIGIDRLHDQMFYEPSYDEIIYSEF
jgi:malate dehydrogenase (oxaloacetate-decarboxylating)(NADP+)